jgi:magnesium transporter
VEDTLTLQHQPKVEDYGTHLFVIIRGIDFNRADGELDTLKLAAFLDERRLVTSHRAPMRSVEVVRQRLATAGVAAFAGPVQLYHALCDLLVDLYFPAVDEAEDEIEALEDQVFASPEPAQLQRILVLRRRLATLRRVMLPHRQVFNHLANAQTRFVDAGTALFFRDIYDNVFRLADALDQQRDQLANVKDTYLSVISQRTNEVMKVLTLFSAILLPLTFLAGIYGMNFEHMPELATRFGYFAVLAVMAVVAGGLLAWFRHKGWL